MDVPVVQQQVYQPPDVHLGYHQPPPIPIGEQVFDQTVTRSDGTVVARRHLHNVDHYVPAPLPVIATPPPEIRAVQNTVRVPITTHHQISIPTPVEEEHIELQEEAVTVYDTERIPKTVYKEVPHTVEVPYEEEVQEVRYETHTEIVPRTVYDKVEHTVPVPVTNVVKKVRSETHVDHVPETIYEERQVPRTVIQQHPVAVKQTVMKQTPATVAVTHW